ncbi:hypothetical protein [Streptomyces sp. NBC_01538]|uniref:hypothetical protein n=1 Tax=Streptomyces sp. NBC_01538 TaxID=2903897 RepID=UPI0038702433
MNVPVIVVLLAVGARVIPESRNPVPRRWDLASVVLSVTGLAGVVYALKQIGEHAGVSPVILAMAAAGSVLCTSSSTANAASRNRSWTSPCSASAVSAPAPCA